MRTFFPTTDPSAPLRDTRAPGGRAEPGALRVAVYAALFAISTVMVVPLLWMVLTSLKSYEELAVIPPRWIPEKFLWSNYVEALSTFRFDVYLRNSAFLAVTTILGTLISTSMAAFGFVCYPVRGRNWLFGAFLCTLMLPGQVTIIPLFKLYATFGWINTYAPLILPAWLGTNVFAIFLLRQFFLTIPRDYLDAARIDGASELGILFRVYAPLAKPALLTVTVFAFIASWNDLWGPVIFLHRESLYTMPVGLLNFIVIAAQPQGAPWHLVMAISTVMIIPILVVFFLAQRQFIEGISLGGLKG